MSRTGITYLEVINAVKRLQGRGENPTVERIRKALGTGSNSTIARYLKEWRSTNEEPENTQAIPSELRELVGGLWDRLQSKADQQILEARQEAEQKVKAKEEQLIEIQKKYAESQSLVHQLEETLHQQKEENKTIRENLLSEQLELSKSLERVSVLEVQINDQKLENNKLHQLLTHVQKNLEHYQMSVQKLQQEQSISMEKQRNQYEKELSELRSKLSNETNDKDKLKLQLEQIGTLLEKTEKECDQLRKDLKTEEIKGITLQDRFDQLLKQHQEETFMLENKSKCLIEAEQKIAIKEKQVIELKQALKATKDKVQALRHEQLFLVQEKANVDGQLKQLQKFMVKDRAIA